MTRISDNMWLQNLPVCKCEESVVTCIPSDSSPWHARPHGNYWGLWHSQSRLWERLTGRKKDLFGDIFRGLGPRSAGFFTLDLRRGGTSLSRSTQQERWLSTRNVVWTSPMGSGLQILGLKLVVLFGKLMEPSGGGALMEELRPWGWAWRLYSLALLPTSLRWLPVCRWHVIRWLPASVLRPSL